MCHDYRCGLRSDDPFERARVHGHAGRLDVGEHSAGADSQDCRCRIHAGVRDRHDLPPWPASDGTQGELDGVRAVGDGDAVRDAVVGRELGLKRRHHGPEHVPAACNHRRDGRVDVLAHVRRLPLKVVQGDGWGKSGGGRHRYSARFCR